MNWLSFVSNWRKENPTVSYKEALKICSPLYKAEKEGKSAPEPLQTDGIQESQPESVQSPRKERKSRKKKVVIEPEVVEQQVDDEHDEVEVTIKKKKRKGKTRKSRIKSITVDVNSESTEQ